MTLELCFKLASRQPFISIQLLVLAFIALNACMALFIRSNAAPKLWKARVAA